VVAIDDHSRDGSAALVQGYARRDPRIRLLSSPHPGLVAALNHGLQQANGALIARMDGDDRMHPQRLARQVAYLRQHPGITLIGSRARLFPGAQIRAGYREYMRWQNQLLTPKQIATAIYVESPFAHPSVTFRRAAILAAGGYRDGPFPEDYELWLRLHQRGLAMAKLPQELLDWRESGDRTSRTDPRYARVAFDRLRADYLARDPRILAARHQLVFWGAGRNTRKRCAHLIERGFPPTAWIDIDPNKIGNRVQGAWVREPEWLRHASPKPLVLVYVANHGAKELITQQLLGYGYRQGEGFVCVG
jgi:glycosyltransferase involved in cell wall biosynthesis